jgi:tetrahydromethanopterin S-methyltransferase subunit C
MFVAYIALGIVSGIVAAAFALATGSGFLVALAAYIIGGVVGVVCGILWSLAPQREVQQSKRPVTQRS